MERILVIEDDEATARGVVLGLGNEGFEVRSVRSGSDAIQSLEAQSYDLAILDWMLPERDGIAILRWLRGRGLRLPVLLLTARDAVEDRVYGLENGADDYLAKPFAFAELLARVRALLRRAIPAQPWQRRMADLAVNFETRRVMRMGKTIELTPREFDVLAYLIARPGEVVGRDQLAREVWRETQRATPIDNIIDVHVARLRRKLDDGHGQRLLHTVRGLGYVLREETGS